MNTGTIIPSEILQGTITTQSYLSGNISESCNIQGSVMMSGHYIDDCVQITNEELDDICK